MMGFFNQSALKLIFIYALFFVFLMLKEKITSLPLSKKENSYYEQSGKISLSPTRDTEKK